MALSEEHPGVGGRQTKPFGYNLSAVQLPARLRRILRNGGCNTDAWYGDAGQAIGNDAGCASAGLIGAGRRARSRFAPDGRDSPIDGR